MRTTQKNNRNRNLNHKNPNFPQTTAIPQPTHNALNHPEIPQNTAPDNERKMSEMKFKLKKLWIGICIFFWTVLL